MSLRRFIESRPHFSKWIDDFKIEYAYLDHQVGVKLSILNAAIILWINSDQIVKEVEQKRQLEKRIHDYLTKPIEFIDTTPSEDLLTYMEWIKESQNDISEMMGIPESRMGKPEFKSDLAMAFGMSLHSVYNPRFIGRSTTDQILVDHLGYDPHCFIEKPTGEQWSDIYSNRLTVNRNKYDGFLYEHEEKPSFWSKVLSRISSLLKV